MTALHRVRATAEAERLRVVVIADDALVRESLLTALAPDPNLELVNDEAAAHVALVDFPSKWTGAPDARTLALVDDEAHARAALASGASGVVLRRADGARLSAALRAVAAGLTVLDFAMGLPKPSSPPTPALTKRENEVLELIAAGLSNRRIAKRLGISEHTAKFHVNGVMTKLDARTRTDAVVRAARTGIMAL